MKKVIMTMMAALFISSAAFAQENKEQGKCRRTKNRVSAVSRSASSASAVKRSVATRKTATRSSTRRIS